MRKLAKLCNGRASSSARTDWGLAMRLGQRLSGGVGVGAEAHQAQHARTGSSGSTSARGEEALIGEAVERRLLRLAETLGRKAVVGTVYGVAIRRPR